MLPASQGPFAAQGQRYGELFKFFPEATVMGLFEPRYRSVRINPDPDDLVGAGEELILIRPTCAAMAEYQPLDVPVLTDPGEDTLCIQRDVALLAKPCPQSPLGSFS